MTLPAPSEEPGFSLPHIDLDTSTIPLRCFYFPEGSDDPARTVLCIPGMSASGLSFARLRPLSKSYRFLLLSAPVDRYEGGSRQAFASAVCELVQQYDRPVVLGTSFGGLVAIDVASRDSSVIRGLVLATAFARNHAFPPPLRLIEIILPRLQWLAKFIAPVTSRFSGGTTLDRVAARELAREAAETTAAERRSRLQEVFDSDLRGMLQSIDVPSLVIHGTRDLMASKRDSLELAALLPHSRYVEIRGAKHVPYLSHPVEFNRLLDGFLRTVFDEHDA